MLLEYSSKIDSLLQDHYTADNILVLEGKKSMEYFTNFNKSKKLLIRCNRPTYQDINKYINYYIRTNYSVCDDTAYSIISSKLQESKNLLCINQEINKYIAYFYPT